MAFRYKDFISSNIREEDGRYYGTIENTNDFISFSGIDMEDCEKQFKASVDDYLELCEEVGKDPYINQ